MFHVEHSTSWATAMLFKTKKLAIVDMPADAMHMTRGRKALPRVIVLHASAGVDSRAWLTTTSRPVVSCHRLIARDGTLYKIVRDEDTAYAQGFASMGRWHRAADINMNDVGLSIEFENLNDGKQHYTNVQLEVGAAQCFEWWGKYGFLPIVGHSEIYEPKTDPRGFPWDSFNEELLALITDLSRI